MSSKMSSNMSSKTDIRFWSNESGWNPKNHSDRQEKEMRRKLKSRSDPVSSIAATVAYGHLDLKQYQREGTVVNVIEFAPAQECDDLVMEMHDRVTSSLGQTVVDIHTSRVINKRRYAGIRFEVWIVIPRSNTTDVFVRDMLASVLHRVDMAVVDVKRKPSESTGRLADNNRCYKVTVKRSQKRFNFTVTIQNWLPYRRGRRRGVSRGMSSAVLTAPKKKWDSGAIVTAPRNRTFEQSLKDCWLMMSPKTKHEVIPRAVKLIRTELSTGSAEQYTARCGAVLTMLIETASHSIVCTQNTIAYSFITNIGAVVACYNRKYGDETKHVPSFGRYVLERLTLCIGRCMDLSSDVIHTLVSGSDETTTDETTSDETVPWVVRSCMYLLANDKTDDSRMKSLVGICSAAPIMLVDLWLQGAVSVKDLTKAIQAFDHETIGDLQGRMVLETFQFVVNQTKQFPTHDTTWLLPTLKRCFANRHGWKSQTVCRAMDLLENDLFVQTSSNCTTTKARPVQNRRKTSTEATSEGSENSLSMSPGNPWMEPRSSRCRRRNRRNNPRGRSRGYSNGGGSYDRISSSSMPTTMSQLESRIIHFCQCPDQVKREHVFRRNTPPEQFLQAMFNCLANSQHTEPTKTLRGLKILAKCLIDARLIRRCHVQRALNVIMEHVDDICQDFSEYETYLMDLVTSLVPGVERPANMLVALSVIEDM